MPVKMSDVALFVLLLTLRLIGIFGAKQNNRIQQLCDKGIQEKLDRLTNEVIQLREMFQDINESNITEKASNTSTVHEGDTINILSVSRNSLQDGRVLYTIRYQVPADSDLLSPKTTIWAKIENFTYTPLPNTVFAEIPTLPPGVFETSTTTNVSNKSFVIATLGKGDGNWLTIYLNNEEENNLTETDIKIPLLNITTKDDIVYELGQNATFTIEHFSEDYANRGITLAWSSHFEAEYFLTKPGHEKLITRAQTEEEPFYLESEEMLEDKVIKRIGIQNSNTSYSGLLIIHSGASMEGRQLVIRVDLYRLVILHPTTQRGAFPEGKIYKRQSFRKQNENGKEFIYCGFGKKCQEDCQFYGNNLTNLNLLKTVNGNTTLESFLETSELTQPTYLKHGLFELSPKEGDPSPVTYTCKVENVEGQSLYSSVTVYFGHDVEILRNETRMELFDNGTAKVMCTASGFPLPEIWIQCGYSQVKSNVLYQSEKVIRVMGMCRDVNKESWIDCSAGNEFQLKTHRFN